MKTAMSRELAAAVRNEKKGEHKRARDVLDRPTDRKYFRNVKKSEGEMQALEDVGNGLGLL
jgi:hypothetical protein